ncbi:MAG: TolC family outer membrane protein [Alphaproteobacteria bacterium]
MSAQTITEALATAYTTNPTLGAQRQQLRATDELMPQARSGYRPSIFVDADVGLAYRDSDQASSDTGTPGGGALSVTQPLYRGGKTTAEVARARNLIQAERARFYDVELRVLFDGVVVYMNVVRDLAVLDLARNNEQVIGRQLEATSDRFEVGEVTRTDVAQAEARLATAVADRIRAEGNIIAARAAFRNVIGIEPGSVESPGPLGGLPVGEQEALTIAGREHPAIIAADFAEQAAQDDVRIAEGDLLPELRLRAVASRDYDVSDFIDRQDNAALLAELSIPLYEAGFTHSRVRENKLRAGQRRLEASQIRLDVAEDVTRSWEALVTAEAQIEAFQEGVRAAEIALDGLEREALVGSRTVLDVLDGEQELFQARVDLVRAERDLVVASYAMQASIGRLSAQSLGLPVEPFDVEDYYNRVRDAWWGTAVE